MKGGSSVKPGRELHWIATEVCRHNRLVTSEGHVGKNLKGTLLSGVVSEVMSATPTPRQRLHTLRLLFRIGLGRLPPQPTRKYSMAMILDEIELGRGGFYGLRLTQQMSFRPVKIPLPWLPSGKTGISVVRGFLRQDPYSDLVLRVTPYSNDERAVACVEHGDALILHDPTQHVVINESHKLENFAVEGLADAFAYEETIEGSIGTNKVLFIFSHVGSVFFALQAGSGGDFWTWDDVAKIATVQADKIRRTKGVLTKIFD